MQCGCAQRCECGSQIRLADTPTSVLYTHSRARHDRIAHTCLRVKQLGSLPDWIKMADGQGPANALLFIVLLLWGVPLSLFASVLSLHQFKVLYGLLANLSQKRYKNNVWRSARPCETFLLSFTIERQPLFYICVLYILGAAAS